MLKKQFKSGATMQRRSFLSLAITAASAAVYGQSFTPEGPSVIHPVLSAKDRLNEAHSLGITSIAFKVLTRDTNGELFIIEHTTRQKGGPPRHIHPHQDEWFYVMEGEFLFEVGHDRVTLQPGGSILAPRNLPHAWAFIGSNGGKMLISYTPAGKMEPFFREVTKTNSMPPQDKALFERFDLILTGPPLLV
jgi:quercetin dioxygenase-like cupin family protein